MRNPAQFPAFSRLLHWLMAVMVLAMLFIGVGMAASVSERYHLLVSIHRPLGIAILVLVVIRFINRLFNRRSGSVWPRRCPIICFMR
jgi:cytochrome b561